MTTEPTVQPFATGALPTPPDKLAQGWDVRLALAAAPTAAPAKFHHPGCGPTLNQLPYGACVGFGVTAVHAAQEFADEGRQLLPNVLDALRLYADSKGLSWPPTGQGWDPVEGTWPALVLAHAKARGLPTKDGSPPRRISAYYLLGVPDGSLAFLDVFQQTLQQLGPVLLSTLWPHNWFSVLAGGYMQPPSFAFAPSGHAYEACGWVTGCPLNYPGCQYDTIAHQSWGPWGKDPEFKDHFRIHSPHLALVGKEAWKSVDISGDAPAPPPPPEGKMTLPIYDAAPKHQLVDIAVGTQLYATDGKTPLVKLSSGGTGIGSPFATSATQRLVRVSVGGIIQGAIVATAACANLRPIAAPADTKAAWNDGVTAASTAALTARKP